MRWFALFVLDERKATDALTEAGFDVFYPTFARYTLRRHRIVRTDAPIFPRYIFAAIDPDACRDPLRSAGVAYIVGAAGQPRPIPAPIIEAVRLMASSGELDEAEPTLPAPKPKRIRYKGMQALRVWLDANRPKAPILDEA